MRRGMKQIGPDRINPKLTTASMLSFTTETYWSKLIAILICRSAISIDVNKSKNWSPPFWKASMISFHVKIKLNTVCHKFSIPSHDRIKEKWPEGAMKLKLQKFLSFYSKSSCFCALAWVRLLEVRKGTLTRSTCPTPLPFPY